MCHGTHKRMVTLKGTVTGKPGAPRQQSRERYESVQRSQSVTTSDRLKELSRGVESQGNVTRALSFTGRGGSEADDPASAALNSTGQGKIASQYNCNPPPGH